jgi:beta-galactosidase GanA
MESLGQNMLTEPSDKFFGSDGHALPLPTSHVLVAKGDLPVVHAENPAVADGHTIHVTTEVVQNPIDVADHRFAVNDPGPMPDGFRNVVSLHRGTEEIFEQPSKYLAEGFDRNQIPGTGGTPLARFEIEPSAGDQAVDVRMIGQGPAPGVQDGEDADASSDVVRIRCQLHERMSGGFHEKTVAFSLPLAQEGT